ncbi:MAG TPA: hypothetical protein VEA19_02920 [Actinomycetota bacterium]|nr:hypothetical protein [Actinomycetota bacterium]
MRKIFAVLCALVPVALGGSVAPASPLAGPAERVAAVSLAPPGSPNDGHLALKAALDRQLSSEDAAADSSLPGQRHPWRIPRSSTDRPDEKAGRLLHIVYVLPAGAPDDQYDEKGIIDDSMRAMNAWTRQQTGNQKQWRLDTFTFEWDDPDTTQIENIRVNAVDVTFIRSNRLDDQLDSVSEVEGELVGRGLNKSNKRYLSFVASNAGGVCGDAWWSYVPTQDDFDGQYSDVYLYSSSGCRARDWAPNATTPAYTESIAMQEMIHNDGIVPPGAPHGCGPTSLPAHVCNPALILTPELDPEYTDVMYPFVGLPLSQKVIDDDNLDYYGTPYPGIRDLDQGLYLENV